MQITEKY